MARVLCTLCLAACTTTTGAGEPDAGSGAQPGGGGTGGQPPDSGPQDDAGGDAGNDLCTPSATVYPYTVEVIGEALEEAEGADVHVYTAMMFASGAGTCTGQAVTTVSGGGFQLTVTSHSDGAAYPRVVVWIDVDGDGDCGSGDLLHDQYWTVGTHASRTLSRADFDASATGACVPFGGDAMATHQGDGGTDASLDGCSFVDSTPVPGDLRATLSVSGTGMQGMDGRTVWVHTSTWDLSPIAVARAVVDGGRFEAVLPDGVTHYTAVGLYVDLDDNARCSTDEPMYEMTTGIADVDTVLELGPADFTPGSCLVNGGVGDLTTALSCPP